MSAERERKESSTQSPGYGQAAGKVILIGEHAVVHGVPALVAGLNRGARARATLNEQDQVFAGDDELALDHELYQGLKRLRELLDMPQTRLELQLEIPSGSGLGASAALGVAAARALVELRENVYGFETSEQQLCTAIDAWENVFHGNASGVDAAAARLGGVLEFTRGAATTPVSSTRVLNLAIAIAGPPAPTKMMVAGVARYKERNPQQFAETLAAFHSLTSNAVACLRAGDHEGLGKLFDLAQILLAGWMVSTSEIENACRIAREAGALGAKLTGSGGGGCVVAVCASPESTKQVLLSWQNAGLQAFSSEVQASLPTTK
ncbi:MAG: mevalonate kinase [Polyangiaceae bacterium]|nr:mevalonate kinase [Polyangiaceae bacterium]